MKRVEEISLAELRQMSEKMYGTMVKADVDISKGILLVDMEMHADGEAYLLSDGSNQADLWGINLHPDKFGTNEFIEYDSMINIRPRQSNPNRVILDEGVRNDIRDVVDRIVHE